MKRSKLPTLAQAKRAARGRGWTIRCLRVNHRGTRVVCTDQRNRLRSIKARG